MVNLECQSSAFLFDNDSTRYLRKISSSVHLYDDLSHSMAMKFQVETDEDDLRSPSKMTNSDSSDSAIVADDFEEGTSWTDRQTSNYRNSWPKMMEKFLPRPSTSFASLSQSFDILNQLDRLPIDDRHSSSNSIEQKYKHPLPWFKSPSPPTSNKVLCFSLRHFDQTVESILTALASSFVSSRTTLHWFGN